MKNTRTLISSSIVSIIIVVLGMFMLCMSRAPQISFDEPLIEGGGVENDSVSADDDDFLNSLTEETNTTTPTENNSESTSDDDFLSLLDEGEENTQSYNQSSESSDEGLDDIMKALELDDNANSESLSKNDDSADSEIQSNDNNDNEDDWLKALTETESDTESESENTLAQTADSNSPENESVDQLSKEVEQLETVLAEKNKTAENLQAEIKQYDQQISQAQRQSSASGAKRSQVQRVSYVEPTPANETNKYNADTEVARTSTSGSFDNAYNVALDLFQKHQYPQAVDAFYQLIQQNSSHPLADNCQYWIGESRYAEGKYYQAIAEFNKVFAYDTPEKQDDAQLMLGLTYLKLGELGSARIEFDWLVSCYASSEYANTAHRYLGQF